MFLFTVSCLGFTRMTQSLHPTVVARQIAWPVRGNIIARIRGLNASKMVGWPGPPPHPTGRSATAMKVVVIEVVMVFLWS